MIPFNKVHSTGKEIQYLSEAIANGKLSGNGPFTVLCQNFFEKKSLKTPFLLYFCCCL